MPRILSIETALESCGVALGKDGRVLSTLEKTGENVHATQLTVMIDEILKNAGITTKELNAVSISQGPGSYTGLRIGSSAAKGICYALDIPLIAVDTLKIMAKTALAAGEKGLLCPMIDARRMEVYYSVYDKDLNQVGDTEAAVVTGDFLSDLLIENKVIFFGNGMPKCRELLSKNENAFFIGDIKPSPAEQLVLAFEKYDAKEFEDIIRFEPFYLKNFVPGAAGGRMLRALKKD
jgi:tRNA threonylcarbamoyladenosine biosynthesis protein TsaB